MNTGTVSLRHRPFLTPIWLTAMAAFLAFLIVVFAAVAMWKLGTSDSTLLIVIREAETDHAAGAARAAVLVRMFGGDASTGRLDAIYVSRTAASQATAAPLAAALNLIPIVAAADDPSALARRAMQEHAGGRVLIVGDPLTVPAIVAQLSGGRRIDRMGETEYGLYIVTVPRIGHANVLRMTY